MGTIRYIAGAVILISFLTFVAFFGRNPLLRKTPVSWLHRVIWVHIPSGLRTVDQKLTHGRITSWIIKQAKHLWNDRHPLVLAHSNSSFKITDFQSVVLSSVTTSLLIVVQKSILFISFTKFIIGLHGVSEVIFLPPAWPLLSKSRKFLASIVVALPWIFLYASATTDPGYISQTNHNQQMALYPYDFTMFYPGQFCRTCRLLKPARSKHCSICKRCISKADHHCIFINNCVGYRNHHFFILLVSTTALLTTYATYVGSSLLSEVILKEIPRWTMRGTGYTWTQYGGIIAWVLNKQTRIGSITLLCLLTSPLVIGLSSYHLYLIWIGATTNETLKMSDLSTDMADGYAFKRTLSKDRPKNERYEPLWTRWPCESGHIISRSYDGRLPDPEIIGSGEWERVWKLADIPNLYDLGLVNNLREIFLPGCSLQKVDQ